jgi:hypothetical protein
MTAAYGPTPLDRALEALRHPYRRRVLRLVTEPPRPGEPLSVGRLVDAVDDPPDAARVALYHVHLPRLAEAGYVEWDRSHGTVRRGPALDEVAPVLRALDDYRDAVPGRE